MPRPDWLLIQGRLVLIAALRRLAACETADKAVCATGAAPLRTTSGCTRYHPGSNLPLGEEAFSRLNRLVHESRCQSAAPALPRDGAGGAAVGHPRRRQHLGETESGTICGQSERLPAGHA